jgi:hypothetical protein
MKNQDSMGNTKSFLSTLPFSLGSFRHMATCRSSSKNTGKMNLIPIFNKTSPHAHMELELNVLGVLKMLMGYIVHLSKRKN